MYFERVYNYVRVFPLFESAYWQELSLRYRFHKFYLSQKIAQIMNLIQEISYFVIVLSINIESISSFLNLNVMFTVLLLSNLLAIEREPDLSVCTLSIH